MHTTSSFQSQYTGKLYHKESDCLSDEFYALREKAASQLSAFFVHRFAQRRNDAAYTDLWRTLKNLRDTEAAFYEALGRERVTDAETLSTLTTQAADIQLPKEAAA